jgi:hypothetical protein
MKVVRLHLKTGKTERIELNSNTTFDMSSHGVWIAVSDHSGQKTEIFYPYTAILKLVREIVND